MAKKPKFMLIGLDSLSIEIIDRYAKDGTAPTLNKMIRKGVSGHALPEFPIYTPTNWAVLSTGTRPGTNSAPDWFNDYSGEYLSTFNSRSISCETIQDAAARQGLKVLSVMYPSAYPVRNKNSIALAPLHKGLLSNEVYSGKVWDIALTKGKGTIPFITAEELGIIQTDAARAKAVGAIEDGADFGTVRKKKVKAKGLTFDLTITKNSFKIMHKKKSISQDTVGTWSDFAVMTMPTQQGNRKGSVRFKVFKPAKGKVRVACSGVYDINMLVTPRRHLDDLLKKVGPVFEHATFNKFLKVGSPTLKQDLAETEKELEYQTDWIIRASEYMQKKEGWDIFYLHWHFPDNILHRVLAEADASSPVANPSGIRQGRMVIRTALRLCDRLVKGLHALAGPDTNICIVSDHGNVPNQYSCSVERRLADAGLLKLKQDGSVDINRSRAYVPSWKYKVNVNIKNGTKGAVPKGDYEKVQEEIIDALHDWKDPETGKRVVAFALKKKDAPIIGFWGETAGDVTFFYNSGFAWFGNAKDPSVMPAKGGANHGPQMPTTFTDYASNMAFFIINGPEVKRNSRMTEERGYMKLVDVLPTLCHLSDIDPPKDCEGAVRYRVLR
jgi:predicted AlkP superfamily phosphohydrolase/phosphomutase